MSLQHGLSGLNAAARNLDVIGNNVANANTVGAKASRAEFADVYANSLTGASSSSSAGLGVAVSNVAQQFTQGDIVSTQNPLDMAINGRGFFRLSDDGVISYTRNGQFRMDDSGYIVTASGANVTGYSVDTNGRISNGRPTELRVSAADIAPKATETSRAQFNLDARKPVLTNTFDVSDPRTYQGAVSMSVNDSLGREHEVTLYMRKTAANEWQVRAAADGQVLDAAAFSQTLSFDSSGTMSSPTGPFNLTIPVGADAGNSLTFAVNLTEATQFGGDFATNEVRTDGYGSGRLSGFSVDESGVIVGRYSNGQTRPMGQIVLASFSNPQGLSPNGGNSWSESGASGQPTMGTPGSASLGGLQGGALENSNVDLTAELVNMITAQRVYQANAQTIKTADQLMQTIVNLR